MDDIFSGSDNFLIAFGPEADPVGLVDGLGERFEVTQTNIKKWTVGSPIQAPLDALQSILQEHAFQLDQLERVVDASRAVKPEQSTIAACRIFPCSR